ncbi:hypothetical protein O181_092767 [Austropuccinia psidii MF-1]|uniref:Integrase catalytic domain-containing protein n=1 Tax=Austropuccinia psidii MF-1 TaxID=1389203 RepID=A0A9Q3J054_9BASI|nr:hypothetical protein [Austropuccinia psidii MF-1]
MLLTEASLWHNQLGNPGPAVIKSMGIPGPDEDCHVCNINKDHKKPFKIQSEHKNIPLDCVNLYLVGPISPPSVSGKQYLLTIVDQAKSFKHFPFLKKKSDAYEEFVAVKKMMDNQQNCSIKKFFSDQGGGFLNHKFQELETTSGFIHCFSPSYTPEHNEFAEQAN